MKTKYQINTIKWSSIALLTLSSRAKALKVQKTFLSSHEIIEQNFLSEVNCMIW